MANDDRSRREDEHSKGLVRKTLERAMGLIALLFLSLLLSIMMEWLGMAFIWKEEGTAHSRNMLQNEISFLQEDFQRRLFKSSPAELATETALIAYDWAVARSGYLALRQRLTQPVLSTEPTLMAFTKRLYAGIEKYITAAFNILLVFTVRLLVIALSAPIIVLVGVAALVDGLVQRDLRRFGGGREYGMVYHAAKTVMGPLLLLPVFFYLTVPFSIHPNFVLMPAAALMALVIFITTSTFKKYL